MAITSTPRVRQRFRPRLLPCQVPVVLAGRIGKIQQQSETLRNENGILSATTSRVPRLVRIKQPYMPKTF